uniref:Uncharacterized protein n=1 Tax=Cannabis sativa TaxID=3483 RepID=A0A803PY47_CANSA
MWKQKIKDHPPSPSLLLPNGKEKSLILNIPMESRFEEPSTDIIVECYLLIGLPRKVVSIEELDIVDSDRYNEYGWGQECLR